MGEASGKLPSSPGLRVCIVAQNASMTYGGEASLPWLCFKYLRHRGVDAHLVCHGRTRDEVLAGFPQDHDRLHFSPETKIDRLLWRLGSFLPVKIDAQTFGSLRHIYNQRLQRRIVRRLIAEKQIQIVHEINPVSPRQVSAMYNLGVPVVIGPLAGGTRYPPAFMYLEPRGAQTVESLGHAIARVLNFFVPGKKRAAGLIVANEQSRAALPRGVRGKIFYIPDVGVDLRVWSKQAAPTRDDGPIRFAYLGRLADWKGLQFLLPAFQIVAQRQPRAFLEILGDGEERKKLQELARQLGLSDRVTFAGWVSAEQGAQRLQQAAALVLPSLREVGGIVALEAMAMGLPVIATAWGGPANHVTAESGIHVAPDSPQIFVLGLADAMLRLADDPPLRQRLGAAGRRRVQENLYDWNAKIDRLLQIYPELIGEHSAR